MYAKLFFAYSRIKRWIGPDARKSFTVQGLWSERQSGYLAAAATPLLEYN